MGVKLTVTLENGVNFMVVFKHDEGIIQSVLIKYTKMLLIRRVDYTLTFLKGDDQT